MVFMRVMIFQILKTVAAPWISAVLCHFVEPMRTRGLVSMEAVLVIKDISSTNRLVNSHAFGSSFIVLSLIWSFYVSFSLIFCQKALRCRLRLWCLHALLFSCSVNSKQEMKNLHRSLFLYAVALQVLEHGQSVFYFITLIICTFFKAWISIDKYLKLQLGSSFALLRDKSELWETWTGNMFLCKPFSP